MGGSYLERPPEVEFYANAMRDVTVIFRAFSVRCGKAASGRRTARRPRVAENIRVNYGSFVVKSGPRQTILR